MANLYIEEFSQLPIDARLAAPQIGSQPSVASQKVSFGSSTQSAAFNSSTKFVRVLADANCHLAFGANPTATTSSMRCVADSAEYFGVVAGQKVAVISG